jgi:hypothetical protein
MTLVLLARIDAAETLTERALAMHFLLAMAENLTYKASSATGQRPTEREKKK